MARDRGTLDLFAWKPPRVAAEFAPEKVRAASIRAGIAKGVSLILKECGLSREQVADEIAAYLGEPCSKAMLDAYASEAREEHSIPLVRFVGLLHATKDIRPLGQIAKEFGYAVIPEKYLPAIDEAILADKIEELQQRKTLARKTWKGV